MNLSKEFLEAAEKCASYIFHSESERKSYQEHIEEGNNPRDHIFYQASRVLNVDEEFDVDIQEYESRIDK